MTKSILAVFVSLFVVHSMSESQLIRHCGLKAGIASTNQNWAWPAQASVSANSTSRLGVDVGAFVEWLDIPLFSVLTELHYIQKGSEATTNVPITTAQFPDGTGQFLSYSTRINYCSVPLLAKLRMNWGVFSPYVIAGPRFDLYLSNDGTFPSHDFNKLDVGGTLGIGVELPSVLPVQIGAELRYSPSFQDAYSVQSLTIRNRSLEILLVLAY